MIKLVLDGRGLQTHVQPSSAPLWHSAMVRSGQMAVQQPTTVQLLVVALEVPE